MAAERNCSECNIQFNTLYRIRHLQKHYAKKEWVFACRKCLLKGKKIISITSMEVPGKAVFSPLL